MSDLLTHAEYQALAADLNPPRSPFIDGKYHTGRGAMMTTTSLDVHGTEATAADRRRNTATAQSVSAGTVHT